MRSTFVSWVLRIALGLALAYGLVSLGAWVFQDRFAFPGGTGPLPHPVEYGFPDGEWVSTTADDGVLLRGWYLPPDPAPPGGAPAPGLIWFYGNMETVAGIAPVLREFRPPGIALLVLDYRGYGRSEGIPSEEGAYRDAKAAWELLARRPDVDSTRIVLYGRSIGSAVALYLATEHVVRAVVLDSPFSTGADMARQHYRFLPINLMRLSLDNLERAERLTAPLLVFHGSEDFIAPVEMGEAVARAGRAEEFIVVEGAGHNDTYLLGGDAYRARMHAFLAAHLADGPR